MPHIKGFSSYSGSMNKNGPSPSEVSRPGTAGKTSNAASGKYSLMLITELLLLQYYYDYDYDYYYYCTKLSNAVSLGPEFKRMGVVVLPLKSSALCHHCASGRVPGIPGVLGSDKSLVSTSRRASCAMDVTKPYTSMAPNLINS